MLIKEIELLYEMEKTRIMFQHLARRLRAAKSAEEVISIFESALS